MAISYKAIKAINMLQLQTSLHSTSFILVVISCLSWRRGDLTIANVTCVPYNTWGYMRNVLKKRVRFISRETATYATNISLPVNLIVKLITKLDKHTKEYKRYLPVPWCSRCSCSFFPQSHEHMHGGYGVIYSTLWFNGSLNVGDLYVYIYIYT